MRPLVGLALALWLLHPARQSEVQEPKPPASRSADFAPMEREQLAWHCAAIAANDASLVPVATLCEFALSLPRILPNFICAQTTEQYSDVRGTAPVVIKAEVTYENGQTRYGNVTRNGQPTEGMMSSLGGRVLSAGEFGSELVGLFRPETGAEFKFRKLARMGSVTVLVFDLHVARGNNHFFSVGNSDGRIQPEYRGALWLEKDTSRLRRVELEPLHMGADFVFQSAKFTTEYGEINLGDGGVFVLPTSSQIAACLLRSTMLPGGMPRATTRCMRNRLSFSNCHKFAGKARIVDVTPP